MTYDFDISSDVSLSKILDAFIIENESTSTIIAFLQQHLDNVKDILHYSLYYNRIFQLDFFLKCNDDEQAYVIRNLLKDIDQHDAAILIWQILKSNSGNVQHAKWHLKKDMMQMLDKCQIRHPYSYGHENYIAPLDKVCFKMAQDNSMSYIPNLIANDKLRPFFKTLSYSLFQKRLMQYDFFAELDSLSKYAFINTAFSACNFRDVVRFSLQLLDSDEAVDVKKFCLTKLGSFARAYDIIDTHVYDVISQCKSFAEFMLKSMMFDANVTMFAVLYFLLYNRKWIEEWATTDEEGLNAILNVSELVKQQ